MYGLQALAVLPNRVPVADSQPIGMDTNLEGMESFKSLFSQLITTALDSEQTTTYSALEKLLQAEKPVIAPLLSQLVNRAGEFSLAEEANTELIQFLQQLNEAFEEALTNGFDAESLSSLYELFQQIPLTLPVELPQMQETPQKDGVASNQLQGLIAFLKWDKLMQEVLAVQEQGTKEASMEHKQYSTNLLPEAIQTLMKQWGQEEKWLQFLRQQLAVESKELRPLVSDMGKSETKAVLSMPSFIPSAFLQELKATEQQPVFKSVMSEQQAQALPKLEPQAPTMIQASDSKPTLEVQGLDKQLAPVAEKQAPTVRFSHMLEDIKAVFKNQPQLFNNQDMSQIRVKLHPEHLGHLDIKITSVAGKITAHLLTSSLMAKEALEMQLGQLRIALTNLGVQVDKIEVAQQAQMNTNLHDQRSSSQQFLQQQNQGQKKNDPNTAFTVSEDEAEEAIDHDHRHPMSNINVVV